MEENAILRVISGVAKGHKLKTLKGNATRPTTDRVKESLFNIISPKIPGAVVLDLFAGTGSLGIEALSRGADRAVFVDRSRESTEVIKDNLIHTKLYDQATIITGEFSGALDRIPDAGLKFDLVFLDPPYGKGLIGEALSMLCALDVLNYGCIVAAEHSRDDAVPESVKQLKLFRNQKYGDTVISFYSTFSDLA